MSTHDYNIANASGASVRSDLNSALAQPRGTGLFESYFIDLIKLIMTLILTYISKKEFQT